MTTKRDLDTAAEVSLKICGKCGWYDTFGHAAECNPERGRFAAQLIASVPDVRSGQLGYGEGHVVFDLDKGFTIVFRRGRHAFMLDHIHLLEDLNVDESAALVRALKSWMDGIADKRISAFEARKREMTHHTSCATHDAPKRTDDWTLVDCPTCLRSNKAPPSDPQRKQDQRAEGAMTVDQIVQTIYEERYQEPKDAETATYMRDVMIREVVERTLELSKKG